jgi:hypothetical protein
VHATAGVELALIELWLAACAWHPQDRQRPERVELGEDKSSLEIPASCMAWSIVPDLRMRPSVSTSL